MEGDYAGIYYLVAPLISFPNCRFAPFMMSLASRFLAVVCGWGLIDVALSTDPDPSIFFPDDSSLSMTDTLNPGGFSSDLFSGSALVPDQANLDFSVGTDPNLAGSNPQWLGFNDIDSGALEASCAGDGPQKIGKARREDKPMCFQGSRKNAPDFSGLKLPDFLQLGGLGSEEEEQQPDPQVEFGLDPNNNQNCPKPYDQHVCCTGPGVQSFPDSGIWDFVQDCWPCM